MLDAGDLAILILAVFWAVLVLFLGWVLIRLAQVLKAAEELVSGVTDKTVPLLAEVTTSVVHVNAELERVDAITANVQTMTGNVAHLSSLVGATVGGPLVKVASLAYGVRRAMSRKKRDDVERRVKDAMKAEQAAEKAARRKR